MAAFFQTWLSYIQNNSSYILSQLGTHIYISITAVVFCIAIGFPTAIFMSFHRKWENLIMTIINTLQTIPSMGMLVIFLILFGLGTNTVILLVVIYSLLPIVKNTFAGLNNVDDTYIDSAKGLGMNRWQILFQVQIPLALPIILAGIKNALVLAVGTTTIGSFVGAGGLGDIILRGINTLSGTAILLTGALLCALIAFVFEGLIDWIEKEVTITDSKNLSE